MSKIKFPYLKSTNEIMLVIWMFLSYIFILALHEVLPFLLPNSSSVLVKIGYAVAFTNNDWWDPYSYNFGAPEKAAISFGLAAVWPMSLLIRIGVSPTLSYSLIGSVFLLIAFLASYRIAQSFGVSRKLSSLLALFWLTMPITWGHSGYTTLSWGISLLPLYFYASFRLFGLLPKHSKGSHTVSFSYLGVVLLSVFMDGYTFVMYFVGSTILLLGVTFSQARNRSLSLQTSYLWFVHVSSFFAASLSYQLFIGRGSYPFPGIEVFRAFGLDPIYLLIPTEGRSLVADLLGISVKRSASSLYGDGSIWTTTFALPLLLIFTFLVVTQWKYAGRKLERVLALILLVSTYMSLGPSLKWNLKKEVGQTSAGQEGNSPYPNSTEMLSLGSSVISGNIPGFDSMRASYRWIALALFALWMLVVLRLSRAEYLRKEKMVHAVMIAIVIAIAWNTPSLSKHLKSSHGNLKAMNEIDESLIARLSQYINSGENVVFLPWANDLRLNYVSAKLAIKTPNIGGDKNLRVAQENWPSELKYVRNVIDEASPSPIAFMLTQGIFDAVIIKSESFPKDPKMDSAHGEFGAKRIMRQQIMPELRGYPELIVAAEKDFYVVRLKNEERDNATKESIGRLIETKINYPIVVNSKSEASWFYLKQGWYFPESTHVWSSAKAALRLPVPESCESKKCFALLRFNVFGANSDNPVKVNFKATNGEKNWSEVVVATGGDQLELPVPFDVLGTSSEISISIPKASSPLEQGQSDDSRILGISLTEIALETSS